MKIAKWLNVFLLKGAILSFSSTAGAVVNCTGQDLSGVLVTKNVDFAADVEPIIGNAPSKCSNCHGSQFANQATLVDPTIKAGGLPYVKPGNDDLSLIFKKINCTDLPGNYGIGGRMPANGPLSLQEQALILDWIQQGAKPQQVDPTDYIFYSGFSRN